MDWMKLPPLNSLRAFSAVADTGSYTLAAKRLNVTQAAISQQVKSLEKHLGTSLVTKLGRGIELTDQGMRLARELGTGFEIISRGVERLREDSANRPVQVTMSPAFAVEWLMPRMAEFQRAHPDITLMLNPTSEVVELKPGGIDVAIRYHDHRWPREDVDTVLITDMIVIGAPALVGGQDLRDPASLVDLPWLQELGTNEAADWFTFHGVVPEHPLTVNHMPGNLIMTAVRRGDGITYTARAFFQNDLAAGRVVELFSERCFGTYHIETQQDHLRPEARIFIKWLRSQAETVTA
ncbi:LysR family transcriptional regulator [Aliiroseovarius sp. PrR006]|uniref:LysR family transcriptional regulator n=1 Tax=Aliiroseovarius sp. PrR006 TaxID=2706883 RepID=UPI0013D04661|nr:LysR family transcriptional regulator [Aliiroseovarius sp. PrR006]NDW54328.1 LysR family transcriptional regulator [Aliiroseovarius sp. PrR006]